MIRFSFALPWVLFVLLLGCHSEPDDAESIVLATTTSTYDTGLLDALLPMFTARTGIAVKPIAVGTGAALEMGRRGSADVVLVHAPAAEEQYVRSGDIGEAELVMANDFLIVGPPADPARVGAAVDVLDAMRRISTGGVFFSRGDGSGTEKMELELWLRAGIRVHDVERREESGQGMAATLYMTSERNAYTLTDRGTWLALRDRIVSVPLFEDHDELKNTYHAYVVDPERHPEVDVAGARALVAFFASDPAQQVIADFGRARYGQPLFIPRDAIRAEP